MARNMKRMVLTVAAVALSVCANAQLVVGLQGGYHSQSNTVSWGDDHQNSTAWLGGLQLGWQITPKWYVGVMGGYMASGIDRLQDYDTLPFYSARSNVPIEEHRLGSERPGWTVRPVVRYEIMKYGNMHLNLMLQGSIASMGYATLNESFVTPTINSREYIESDPVKDSISTFSWGVSLRPTLTYEFSTHLSAELSLDFLSVGYAQSQEKHDAEFHTVDGERVADVYHSRTLYAGLNSLMETLRWESPMLRLGFNYTF